MTGAASNGRRPRLAAAALLVAAGGALWPTPAVPLAAADAAVAVGPDARAAEADRAAIRAVLRITAAADVPVRRRLTSA